MKATYKQLSRRALAALLAAVMVLSMTVFASSDGTGESGTDTGTETETAMPFADVSESAWYYDAVLDAYQQQLMIGTGASTFSPDEGTTRAMVVTTLYRLAGEPDVTGMEMPFQDAEEGWYYDALLWACDVGVAKGRSEEVFDSDTPITREETVTFFGRYAQYILEEDVDATAAEADLSAYQDAGQVSDYAVTYMNWAVATGLIIGTSSTTLSPTDTCNRAELATMLSRFYPRQTGLGIVSVYAIGFVDADGAKLQAIAVEYTTQLAAGSVSLEDYNVLDYGTLTDPSCELGENPGQAVNIYVNSAAAVSESGGTATGRFVIIEVNTDYQLASVPSYQQAVAAGVEQVNDLTDVNGKTIAATTEAVVNYEVVSTYNSRQDTYVTTYEAVDGTYSFEDLEGYQLFYKDGTDDGENGGYDTTSAFWAYECFDEEDGELHDVELPYALYVPEDYDPDGNYGLVIQIENAGFLGDDPMIVLTESQAAANFASDEIQEYFKETSGLDGLIVVCPQIAEEIRTTRDNWSTSCGVPATWQLLDYLTETYSIDMDYIYGTGESMGGMQVLCMAAQRDNYFAGLWLPGCQWGSCYNLEQEYNGSVYYSSDDATIWREDADGNSTIETNSLGEEVIARNLYYLISDDNILATTCTGDSFASGVWQELWYLFYDIGGVEIPTATVLPLEDSVEDMNATLTALVNSENDTGIYWLAQDGGSHMLTWVYAHKLDAGYYWLLSQTRTTEMERDKIAQFANDWEAADEETAAAVNAADEGRYLGTVDGEDVYYAVPAEGAGTSGYNSYWSQMGTPISGKEPGWTVSAEDNEEPETISDAIVGVTASGFVDVDGAKLQAIAVEYNVELDADAVSADDYDIDVYQATVSSNDGDGEVGDIVAVYVNTAAEVSEDGGTESGKYVIIEVYTDYICSSELTFTSSLAVGVTQVGDITSDDGIVLASDDAIINYTTTTNSRGQEVNSAIYGTYVIPDIAGFKFYTNLTTYGEPDGEALYVENCFDEKTGEYEDITLSYALYVPEDYDESGNYAMIVIDNPAANEGTHPLVSVLETRSPALMASDWAQDYIREQHEDVDGLIVVVPVVEARVDDNACTPAQYEALVALWDKIQEDYSIDPNYVYGIGQSVGGMVLMETNRNRDNYFAGILMFENQWAQNYYKDTLFVRNQASSESTAATAPMHYPRTNGDITWDYYLDTDGNPVYDDHDPYNLYYLVSDDNIMVMNRSSNNLSNNTWQELSYLYYDLVGYSITQCVVDGTASIEEQEAAIAEYLASDNSFGDQEMGLRWVTFQDGSNGYSARKVLSGYEWLLSQSREDEIEREKLDINKPFELADEQITDGRATSYTDADGNTIYYLTAKAGSGTQFYNTSWLNLTTIADAAPGWLPEGMSWETGVVAATIESVTPILDEDGTLVAVAVEYSQDMEDIVIRLKGDEIIGLDGNVRDDITIVLDPYDFYDADGEQIDCTITNVYVSDTAAIVSGAERGTGSGNYVIVELDTTSTASTIGVVQRTTIRTNLAIASALSTVHTSTSVVSMKTIQTNGSTTIVDSSYDDLYAEGTAEEGVAALVAAGAVTVNGTVINGELSINGAKALWQDEDETWAWKTHIIRSGSGLTYDEAAYACVVGLSRLRGPSYTLTLTNGVVTAIDFIIWDGAFAETVTIGDTYTTVTICGDEGDGSMNRTDPSTVQFSNEYVEADSEGVMPSDQCLILYYQDGDGNWHMKRADSETITYTSAYTYTDSLINLEYSQAWNRPTQPIKALGWMGIESAEMIQWFYCDGITSAFSHVDAQSVLQTAVEKAEALLESLVVSEDGTDVTEDTLWVTQEDYDLYAGAVATAKAVVEDNTLLNTDYEEALLHLAQAYGGDGTNYSKSGNVFEDGIGITNRAQSGTATE
ncbi:MAG: S-layer homology domain-containing protein [Clostridiales bacterium]|nr:S-layer homology domain-containing protein [Clostridiales bacterium]